MGIDNYTYYGPFVEYKPILAERLEKRKGCETCKTSDSAAFCGKCGAKNTNYELAEMREIYLTDITRDALYDPDTGEGFCVGIPNQRTDEIELAGEYSSHGGDKYRPTVVEWKSPEVAVAKFKELFAEHISWLENNGGQPQVKFGVFCYYH
jgi:hypothetical protein